jgi:hypothetical protein
MRSTDKVQWVILAILIFFMTNSAWSAKPEEDWNRTYGGPYGDGAWSLHEAEDGGYIVTGFTSSQGQGSDLWLVKVDSSGQKEWEKTFCGSQEDVGYSVK